MLLDVFRLADALMYVQCTHVKPDEEFTFSPKVKVVTAANEVVWRETDVEHAALLEVLGVYPSKHPAIWQSIGFAIENAFLRGNKGSRNLDVIIRVYKGTLGEVVEIMDEGEGFNYRELVGKVLSGEKYETGTGKGLRTIKNAPVVAGYEGTGSIMNIAILYENIK